jgi:hypothetical protein
MVVREPVMKGIVQEFYHQHNKYYGYSTIIKMKGNIVGFKRVAYRAALSLAVRGTTPTVHRDHTLIWHLPSGGGQSERRFRERILS